MLARLDEGLLAVRREDLTVGGDGRRRDRLHAARVVRVRDAAGVHELDHELAVAGLGDGARDLRPARLLLVVVEPGDVEVALADGGRAGCPRVIRMAALARCA